jgi:cytochrome c oxidase cbb3-type subunit 3
MRNNVFALLLLMSTSLEAWSQGAAAAAPAGDSGIFSDLFARTVLLATAILALAAVIAITQLLNSILRAQQIRLLQEQGIDPYLEEVKKEQEGSAWERLMKRWTNAVPVSKEQDVLLDHEYDGIRELDNSLPPWWVAMFYITIAFAVVYMAYYHFSDAGLSSAQEYEVQMARAEEAKEVFLAKQANKVDENNVVALTDDNELSLGKTIYTANCVACHGAAGEGGVGPNMTDEYWIHGGDIRAVFKTIKNGVPEKGMIAWSAQLRPADMQRVASYIMTMQGTNPPNAKAPEGERYQPEPDAPAPDDTSDNQGE